MTAGRATGGSAGRATGGSAGGPAGPTARVTRRHLLAGTAGGLGALAAAGCSGGGDAGGAARPTTGGSPGSRGEPGGSLVPLDQVPVGGAVVVETGGGPVVVARPERSEVVGFSAVCTHQGCTVAPDGDRLRCPCHGSVYSAATGENLSGPAPRPLDPVALRVADGVVREG